MHFSQPRKDDIYAAPTGLYEPDNTVFPRPTLTLRPGLYYAGLTGLRLRKSRDYLKCEEQSCAHDAVKRGKRSNLIYWDKE